MLAIFNLGLPELAILAGLAICLFGAILIIIGVVIQAVRRRRPDDSSED